MNVTVDWNKPRWTWDAWSCAMVSQVRKRSVYAWVTVNVCGQLVTVSWYMRQVGS